LWEFFFEGLVNWDTKPSKMIKQYKTLSSMIKNDEAFNYLVIIGRLTNGFVSKKWRRDCPKEGCNQHHGELTIHRAWRFNR
jgi:hypothetical protein